VADGVVYCGTRDSTVTTHFVALDAEDGSEVWTADHAAVESDATVYDGVVYYGDDTDTLYARDSATGELLWSRTDGDTMSGSPTYVTGGRSAGKRNEQQVTSWVPAGSPRSIALSTRDGRPTPNGEYRSMKGWGR